MIGTFRELKGRLYGFNHPMEALGPNSRREYSETAISIAAICNEVSNELY